ncbi:class I SAM-dependent methyltransferase [Mesorhizobium caraganae]|uniref:class I SAM-dependent methyltransferase n=1 Tax=Mesorhizobium caraganae TaxID=483206 RepID=UPI00333BAFB4
MLSEVSHADRVTKIRDFSLRALIRLRQAGAEFDLVYVDGCHERESVMMDSVLAWGMLKLGGMLIWDDYTDYKGRQGQLGTSHVRRRWLPGRLRARVSRDLAHQTTHREEDC